MLTGVSTRLVAFLFVAALSLLNRVCKWVGEPFEAYRAPNGNIIIECRKTGLKLTKPTKCSICAFNHLKRGLDLKANLYA